MPSAGIRDAFSAHHAARASTASGSTTSVNTPRCATSPASMVSPVSSRRRASTGPSRWKNMCSDPSAGPRNRVAGMPIIVSRATTAMSAMSASSKPPPRAKPETSATVTFG